MAASNIANVDSSETLQGIDRNQPLSRQLLDVEDAIDDARLVHLAHLQQFLFELIADDAVKPEYIAQVTACKLFAEKIDKHLTEAGNAVAYARTITGDAAHG